MSESTGGCSDSKDKILYNKEDAVLTNLESLNGVIQKSLCKLFLS